MKKIDIFNLDDLPSEQRELFKITTRITEIRPKSIELKTDEEKVNYLYKILPIQEVLLLTDALPIENTVRCFIYCLDDYCFDAVHRSIETNTLFKEKEFKLNSNYYFTYPDHLTFCVGESTLGTHEEPEDKITRNNITQEEKAEQFKINLIKLRHQNSFLDYFRDEEIEKMVVSERHSHFFKKEYSVENYKTSETANFFIKQCKEKPHKVL
jgi:hypothetical protein